MSNLFDDFDLDVTKYSGDDLVIIPDPPIPSITIFANTCTCPQSTDCVGGVTRPSIYIAFCGQKEEYNRLT